MPVPSHIPPPDTRRKCALVREYQKILGNPQLQMLNDVAHAERRRPRSRHPPTVTAEYLSENKFDVLQSRTERRRQNCLHSAEACPASRRSRRGSVGPTPCGQPSTEYAPDVRDVQTCSTNGENFPPQNVTVVQRGQLCSIL